jgi:hypothetical protein
VLIPESNLITEDNKLDDYTDMTTPKLYPQNLKREQLPSYAVVLTGINRDR